MKFLTEELINLDSSQLLKVSDEVRQKCIEIGAKWAEANKRYRDLKELMPSKLATYQMGFMLPGITQTTAKITALSSEGYQDAIREMNTAEFEAELLHVEYRAWMRSLEVLTSIGYVKNQEMKLARYTMVSIQNRI